MMCEPTPGPAHHEQPPLGPRRARGGTLSGFTTAKSTTRIKYQVKESLVYKHNLIPK